MILLDSKRTLLSNRSNQKNNYSKRVVRRNGTFIHSNILSNWAFVENQKRAAQF